MISVWGVDHGPGVVSKRLGHYVVGGALGAGGAGAADKIMSSTDPEYKNKARKDPGTLAGVGGLTAGTFGTLGTGDPRIGLGVGAGAAGTLYALNRKKRKKK